MNGRKKRNLEVMAEKLGEEIAKIACITSTEAPSLSLIDDGIWFILEKASLEVAKVGKV